MSRIRRDATRAGAMLSRMFETGFPDWQRWQQAGCTWLPATAALRDVSAPATWSGFFDHPAAALLESAQALRYTYICDRPARVILGQHDQAEVWSGDLTQRLGRRTGKPLDLVSALLAERRAPRLPDWPAMSGGLIGVFGYDLVQTWERLPLSARRDLELPLYALIETEELFIYDHVAGVLGAVVWRDIRKIDVSLREQFDAARNAANGALERWRRASVAVGSSAKISSKGPAGSAYADASSSFSPEAFKAAARRVHDYTAAGHTYQVNLSRRTSRPTTVAPEAIYEALRRINPSPYMGLLRLPEFSLVCGSPELLVKLENGVIRSRPIAGTRPRGDAPPEDSHFSAELLASEKERAEHLMLVDLIRNDIGRVAEYGSVRVPEFMVLERYSHVMHIVSEVEGRLEPEKNWADVFRSMFPGGTITGCPKVRTMEIIEELEPVGRGFYTGSLGWISYAGDMELNIVIRSMLLQDGVAHVQAGAGVVADSDPARELDEATRKAHALWVALEQAEAASVRSPDA